MSEALQLEPISADDEALDQRIWALRSEGMSLPRIARRLMIPVHELHKRIDAMLPVIDAAARRRCIAESLVLMDEIIGAHKKNLSDPESASVAIRACCERRMILGIGGANMDPVQLSIDSRPVKSTDALDRALAHVAAMGKEPEPEQVPADDVGYPRG